MEINILGGGPAGSAAAIAALTAAVPARIFERSSRRRHKVCGEFITPEACGVLQELGVWDEFLHLRPARIRRCNLHFGGTTKTWELPEFYPKRWLLKCHLMHHHQEQKTR